MAKYKIKVNVELVECDESINSEPIPLWMISQLKNNDEIGS